MLVRVTLPHLCAGVLVDGERIVQAAPILRWSTGKQLTELAAWVLKKGGTIEVVTRLDSGGGG